MPDLANLSISDSLTVTHCPNLKSLSATDPPDQSLVKTLRVDCDSDQRMGFATLQNGKVKNGAGTSNGKSLEDHVRVWVTNRKELGIPETRSSLPFLYGTKKLAECLVCHHFVYPGEEVLCSVRGCQGIYHGVCVKERPGNMKKFTCPQHACFICKQRFCRQRLRWRCVCCPIASHDKCTAWPDEVMHLIGQPRRAVCWRHLTDWRQERKDWCILLNKQHAVSASKIEEVFFRLPLPYTDEEFKIDLMWKHTENNTEPPPYTLIRRNLYLVKKKRDDVDDDVGCRGCTSTCSLDCVCRVQCISCSKACHCSENCTNRPFRKEKKIRIVKTAHCGWGAEAAEFVKKGEYIIEYIGEVIDDALCEKRLWDMKYKEVKNFYMCEIRKDFTIDATFKGNSSRFLNHSCDPNCVLEKWQVEGETRVGVFAARSIEVGEPLTYDYRFVQFGPEVRCCCGAPNCQGYLGTKKKICKVDLSWGKKRKRTTACMAILG